MKTFLISVMVAASFFNSISQSHAFVDMGGRVINEKTGKELYSECLKFDSSNRCEELQILESTSRSVIPKVVTKIKFSESLNLEIKREYPIEAFYYTENLFESTTSSLVTLGAGLGWVAISMVSLAEPFILLTPAVGFGAVAALDIISLPVKLISKKVKQAKLRKLNKKVGEAFNTLITEQTADVTLKDKQYNAFLTVLKGANSK